METITIERAGASMPVRVRAGVDGRWVLFLHGGCADHRTFAGQLAAFDDATLLLPDLRGQGAATLSAGATADFREIVADLVALLRERDAPPVTVVAHSFGSHLAQELAAQHPELVEALVLIGCYDQHATRDAGERSRVAITSGIVRMLPWTWFARFSAHVATGDAVLRAEIRRTHLTAGKDVFLALGRTGSFAKRAVERYEMPVLVVRGEHEYSARLAEVHERIAARSPHGATAVVPATGHLCHQEDPATTNAIIRRFLDAVV